MPQITFSHKTRWRFLFALILLIGLSSCVEKTSSNGSSGNFFSNSMEMAQADENKKKAWKMMEQGKYTEAVELDEKVLAVYEKQLGLEHKKVADCLNDLGVIYGRQGRYVKGGGV